MLNEGKKINQTDEKLREMARQCKVPVPEGYEDRLNKLLSELPEEPDDAHGDQQSRSRGLSKPLVAIVAIVTGISMMGAVSASIEYYRERMHEMRETKVSATIWEMQGDWSGNDTV